MVILVLSNLAVQPQHLPDRLNIIILADLGRADWGCYVLCDSRNDLRDNT